MTQSKDNTLARKGKKLIICRKGQVAVLKKGDYYKRRIADVIGRVPQTFNNEIHRVEITQLKRQKKNGIIYDYYIRAYDCNAVRAAYDKKRLNCGRQPKWADTNAFIEWVDDKMLNDKSSPDIVTGFALKQELFDPSIVPCTTTLYNWIDRGIMRTKNLDLLEKLSRKPKASSQ